MTRKVSKEEKKNFSSEISIGGPKKWQPRRKQRKKQPRKKRPRRRLQRKKPRSKSQG
jgi:hypothetical protein